MEDTGKIIEEVHLYVNKNEALIKVIIWIISWIGGILVLLGTEDKEAIGSAYFIYSLSLLMEFVPKIYKKERFWNKFRHTIFCFAISIVFVFSTAIILGVSLSSVFYTVIFRLTVCVVVYMVIDTFILWLQRERPLMNDENMEINENAHVEQAKFEETLLKGNLGSIKKGEESDE